MVFQLEEFEHLAYSRQHELAARMLLSLLSILDNSYGVPGAQYQAMPLLAVVPGQREAHVGNRLAAAISCLFSDKHFHFSPQSLVTLFGLQRWFASIFGSTDFINADHVVRALNTAGKGNLNQLEIQSADLPKFCLLYLPESEIVLEIDALYKVNKQLAVSLGLSLLSPRFLGSVQAHGKRETLLPWLTEKLPEIENLEALPFGIMHDVYMHCSYADRPDKHAIKGSINVLIRRWMAQQKLTPLNTAVSIPAEGGKPVMLVVMEWFNAGIRFTAPTRARLKQRGRCFMWWAWAWPMPPMRWGTRCLTNGWRSSPGTCRTRFARSEGWPVTARRRFFTCPAWACSR